MITVSELRIHPIKGLKRTLLDTMEIVKTGPLHDRQFMLVDANNQFMSQRTHPQMATIDVVIQNKGVILTIPNQAPLSFQYDEQHGQSFEASIWKDTVKVVELSHQASRGLTEFLGTPCKLVAMMPTHKRLLAEKYSPTREHEVAFADAFPFLLISQASLDDLNGRLEIPVPMDRFRPNIVVNGCAPYEEDTWEVIQIGDIIFDLPKSCSRCLVTTVNQETGVQEKEKGKNPLKALALYRNTEKGILFGQNMMHRSLGAISKGQVLTVLKRRTF